MSEVGSAAPADRGDPWWRFARRRPLPGKAPPDAHNPSPDKQGWRGYLRLLAANRNYRLYLISHFCQHTGDWFVHVASLIAIEQLLPDSGTAISILVATKMTPMILLTSFGGALADRFDRRRLMIVLDAWNASVALLYLLALHYESPALLYTVSFVRHAVVAVYEPVTRSIVPLLVDTDVDLKYAMTLNGMAWAFTLAVGGSFAGWSAATMGVGACYVMDSLTYVVSTVVIWMVRGQFCVRRVSGEGGDERHLAEKAKKEGGGLSIWAFVTRVLSPVTSFVQMFLELMRYLCTCHFGMLVFLKATGNLTWGSADIINVHYSHVDGDELATSTNIGLIYSAVGLGCLVGPIAANFFTDMHRPASLQLVCVGALGFVAAGWLGIAAESFHTIGWLCLFNAIRAFGSSIIWINSTLILQKLTSSDMLGRVLSFDFATTMLCDAVAAFVVGVHEDAGIATSNIAIGAASITGTLLVFWSLYMMAGKGAARKQFNVRDALSPTVSLHKELEKLGETGGDLSLEVGGEDATARLTPGATFT